MCLFFCLDCTELVNEIVYLYCGGATGRLRRFVPNPPLAPQKKKQPLAPQVFCFSFENLLKPGKERGLRHLSARGLLAWAEQRPFKDCVRFHLGFADDIDQRIIKGKGTRASMQLHSWFLHVLVEAHDRVCSWSHDSQTASGASVIWRSSKKEERPRFSPGSACFHAGLPAEEQRGDF